MHTLDHAYEVECPLGLTFRVAGRRQHEGKLRNDAVAAAGLDGGEGLIRAGAFADIVEQRIAGGLGADIGHAQAAPADELPGGLGQIGEGVRAREAPPGQLEFRHDFQQRHHVDFAVEEVVIVELDGIHAETLRQEGQVLLEPRRWRQRCFAAKHRRDSAERAAIAATERRLVTGSALAEIGSGQVLPWIVQLIVRQHSTKARGGKRAVVVVDDPAVLAPT